MKGLATKLMTVLLLVGMLMACTACSGSSSDNSPNDGQTEPLSLWITTLGGEADTIERVTEEIWNKEHPDTPVEVTVVPGNSDDFYQKLSAAFATENGPDMFSISNAELLKYVEADIAYDVSEWIEPNKSDYMEGVLDKLTFDGKIVAFPGNMDVMGVYCNNEMFKEAGIELPKTWDELINAANTLATDERYGIIIQTDVQSGYQMFEFYPFLWMCGGSVLSEDGKNVTINSDAAKQALEFYSKLLNAPGTCKKIENSNTDISPFGTKRTAMQICGSWAISWLAENYSEIDYSVIPYPVPTAGMESSSIIGGWNYMVSSRSSNARTAAEYLNWLWNSDVDIPQEAAATDAKISSRLSVMEAAKDFYSQYPYNVFVEQIMPTARLEPIYPAAVVKAAGEAIQNAAYSGQAIGDILAETEEKCQNALD